MVEMNQRNDERLYLQKEGANEIFINNCQLLKQHQINALRFLYSQFKKKKPGVILNFPPDCGKSVTVALFLYAVRDSLKHPILILCRHDEMTLWKSHILKWTDFNEEDIVIDPPKLMKGKKIFITTTGGASFSQQHSWSVIVIKEDNINKDLCWFLNAYYKIWISSTEMKKDLTMLSFIHDWMFPKLKMNINDFVSSKNNKREMYLKTIYLDSFLEDFVIRENNVKTFNSSKKTINSEAVSNEHNVQTPKKSRKNKDATGTKIKRSRRIVDDDDNAVTNKYKPVNVDIVDKGSENFILFVNNNIHNETIVEDTGFGNISANDCDVKDESGVRSEDLEYLSKDMGNETIIEEIGVINCSINENVRSDSINLNVDLSEDMGKEAMETDCTELISFQNAIDDIVKNECISDKCIESVDFDNKISDIDICEDSKINMQQEDLKNMNCIQRKDGVLDDNSIENVVINPDNNINESFENRKGDKLTNLEDSVLKKFKGSFLDRIF